MAKKKKIKTLSETALRKKWAGSRLASEILLDPEDMLWIPSRFIALSDLTGGGLPYGKIIEIYGEESSGKSLLATDYAYCTQALGGKVLWADAEYSVTKSWMEANGLNLDDMELYREKAIENISDWCIDMGTHYRSQLTHNEPILLVIDSIAALDTLINRRVAQVDRKAEMGNRAKAMDTFLRDRNDFFEEMGITVICINQVRSKIGAGLYEDPNTTPGGKALAFYASIRLGVFGGKQLKGKVAKKEQVVGRQSSIRVKKNKVAPPKASLKACPVYFHPDYKEPIGFNRYHDFAKLVNDAEGMEKKGSRFYLDGKMIANGEDALIREMKKDSTLRKKLIRMTGVNTISITKSKLKAITHNLYPVKAEKDEEDEEE